MTTKTIAQLFDLTSKGAIVTGVAMGIGQTIAPPVEQVKPTNKN